MAWLPIAQTVPQYTSSGEPAAGYVLKFYAAGTATNIVIATDNTGGTTATDALLNADGYPEVTGSVFIPHIDQSYKVVLYPSQAAADSDTGSVWSVDNLTPPVNTVNSVDEKVKVSSNDTTADTLDSKVVSGTNINVTENLDGANENLSVDLKLTADVVPETTSAIDLGTVTKQFKDAQFSGTLTVDTAFSGAAFLDEDDLISDSNTKAASQQSIKAYIDLKTGGLNTKIIDIGDWDMDATLSVSIPHGLTYSKIRSVKALIRNDADSAVYDFSSVNNAVTETAGNFVYATVTDVAITRATTGFFDSTGFDSTSYNRGWIVIRHIN